jgi:hypothetical protein
LSSAILYFAIVAIWAGILMPRWLRPSAHRHRAEEAQHGVAAPEALATFAQPGLEAGDSERAATRSAEDSQRAAARSAEDSERAAARSAEDSERATARSAENDEHAAAWSAENAAARRANVLRARRRMLTTLVLLTLGAFGIAVTHIAAWWVIGPPGLLLAGFLLLLREAARSDAGQARRQAHSAEPKPAEAGQAEAGPAEAGQAEAGQRRRPADRQEKPEVFERIASTPEAPEAEPTPIAEIIDISARVNDQVYDQYTDAAERAVGD